MVQPVAEHLMGLLHEARVSACVCVYILYVYICVCMCVSGECGLWAYITDPPISPLLPKKQPKPKTQASAPTGGGEASSSSGANNGSSGGGGGSKQQQQQTPSLAKRVERCLDRLTAIIRFCEPRPLRRGVVGGGGEEGDVSPAAESLQRLLPVLEAVYGCYKGKGDVMEKVIYIFIIYK